MKIFKRKTKHTAELSKVKRRVSSLPTSELIGWTDQTIYSIGRNLSAWQKSQNQSSLDEAQLGAEVLHAILDTLKERSV